MYLSAESGGPLWEVRYDAWRGGRPLRYLVMTLDARTGEVRQTKG